jgi:hypothetical protein
MQTHCFDISNDINNNTLHEVQLVGFIQVKQFVLHGAH